MANDPTATDLATYMYTQQMVLTCLLEALAVAQPSTAQAVAKRLQLAISNPAPEHPLELAGKLRDYVELIEDCLAKKAH